MYKCQICNRLFYSTVDCQSHLETKHSNSESQSRACLEVNFQCPTCGQLFGHQVDCKNHALREHGIQMQQCIERPI